MVLVDEISATVNRMTAEPEGTLSKTIARKDYEYIHAAMLHSYTPRAKPTAYHDEIWNLGSFTNAG